VAREVEFGEFFASQYPELCRLGYWLTGDWGQAEDLAQEALVRTYWRWLLVRRLDRPDQYTRKVLVNRYRSLLRRALVEARHGRPSRGRAGQRGRGDPRRRPSRGRRRVPHPVQGLAVAELVRRPERVPPVPGPGRL
jgi:DNA-directed RNA polymerase specialized sigma24 family protein